VTWGWGTANPARAGLGISRREEEGKSGAMSAARASQSVKSERCRHLQLQDDELGVVIAALKEKLDRDRCPCAPRLEAASKILE
jgi:hypothetical protein